MALAKDFGFKNLVEYDPKRETYYPTIEYEELESDMQFIEEFEEDSFWEHLGSKLARRDLINKIGRKEYESMESMDRFQEVDKRAAEYHKEFEENGIKNLVISKDE